MGTLFLGKGGWYGVEILQGGIWTGQTKLQITCVGFKACVGWSKSLKAGSPGEAQLLLAVVTVSSAQWQLVGLSMQDSSSCSKEQQPACHCACRNEPENVAERPDCQWANELIKDSC